MMQKKALQLASVASMIDQFNIPNIEILQSLGYKVDVVADFTNPGTITKERAEKLRKRLNDMGVNVYDIAIPRSLNPLAIFKAYRRVSNLIFENEYNLLHCHSPIGGAIARIAARLKRKNGLKVIYTAHGFHFFKGAPLKNWLIYYPVEKFCAKYTDVLITINKEDYELAQRKIHAKKVCYVPGVGIDFERIKSVQADRNEVRKSMGVPENCILLLSVGELNVNKNHQVVVKALAKLDNKNVHYAIAGVGEQKEKLLNLAKELGIENQFHLLGYRTDALKLYHGADVFVFPSFREGLSVSMMEAMASGLPIVCSRIRGNVDLVENTNVQFLPSDEGKLQQILRIVIYDQLLCECLKLENQEHVKFFSLENVLKEMKNIYIENSAMSRERLC